MYNWPWPKVVLCWVLPLAVIPVVSAPAQEMRDPFVSIVNIQAQKAPVIEAKALDLSRIKLKGIIRSKDKFVAIVNDEVVTAGAKVEGLTVAGITQSGIVLEDEKEKSYTISMPQDSLAPKDLQDSPAVVKEPVVALQEMTQAQQPGVALEGEGILGVDSLTGGSLDENSLEKGMLKQ
jgi:hypothetical protein